MLMRISLPPLPYRTLVRASDLQAPLRSEILVVGSGAAALRTAIEAAQKRKVLIVTKQKREESNSRYAQGGIAAPLSGEDTADIHIGDTLKVGWNLSQPALVRAVIEEGAKRVAELLEWGADFDRKGGEIHYGMEGGHSRARVLHRGDRTGAELERALLRKAEENPNIQFIENAFVVDLLRDNGTCVGVLAFDGERLRPVLASRTILATGGLARIFRESTNPSVATGDGIAMALRAGAELIDMEFVQFHPTTLYLAGASRSLISEAVRGAGAVLRDREEHAFMKDYHEKADLAPRDIVSRSILQQMLKTNDTQVYLDVRHLGSERLQDEFPGLVELCQKFQIKLSRDLIPVRPSAHYTIGGIRTDEQGRTTLDGLYAAGECAGTGFHGANRLASNSLLECLVFGARAGADAADSSGTIPDDFEPRQGPSEPAEDLDVADMTNALRSLLWREVGIERDGPQLQDALSRMAFWSRYVLARRFHNPAGWELQNSLLAGETIARSALTREESRGVHYRSDHPEMKLEWEKHIIVQPG